MFQPYKFEPKFMGVGEMKRFAVLMIAVLAAIAVSVALVGCDNNNENNKEQPTPVAAEFFVDGAGLCLVSELDKEERRDFDFNEDRKYTVYVSYILSDGSSQLVRKQVINGDDVGEHIIGVTSDSEKPRLTINIKPSSYTIVELDAEVSFTPRGAISIVENDSGLTEYTYLNIEGYNPAYDGPNFILKYGGEVVDNGYPNKFLSEVEEIDDGKSRETADDPDGGDVIKAYKLTYVVNDSVDIDEIEKKKFKKKGATVSVIVKIVGAELIEEGKSMTGEIRVPRAIMFYEFNVERNGIYTFNGSSDSENRFSFEVIDPESYSRDCSFKQDEVREFYLAAGKYLLQIYDRYGDETQFVVGNYTVGYDFTPPVITQALTEMSDNRYFMGGGYDESVYKFIPVANGRYSFMQGESICEVIDKTSQTVTGRLLAEGEEYYVKVNGREVLKTEIVPDDDMAVGVPETVGEDGCVLKFVPTLTGMYCFNVGGVRVLDSDFNDVDIDKTELKEGITYFMVSGSRDVESITVNLDYDKLRRLGSNCSVEIFGTSKFLLYVENKATYTLSLTVWGNNYSGREFSLYSDNLMPLYIDRTEIDAELECGFYVVQYDDEQCHGGYITVTNDKADDVYDCTFGLSQYIDLYSTGSATFKIRNEGICKPTPAFLAVSYNRIVRLPKIEIYKIVDGEKVSIDYNIGHRDFNVVAALFDIDENDTFIELTMGSSANTLNFFVDLVPENKPSSEKDYEFGYEAADAISVTQNDNGIWEFVYEYDGEYHKPVIWLVDCDGNRIKTNLIMYTHVEGKEEYQNIKEIGDHILDYSIDNDKFLYNGLYYEGYSRSISIIVKIIPQSEAVTE